MPDALNKEVGLLRVRRCPATGAELAAQSISRTPARGVESSRYRHFSRTRPF